MKKVLLTTTALAFAGSAFAAEVSGYVTQGWKQTKKGDDKTTGMHTESEAYVSGSKTASNGLTFGATYTVGLFGSSASDYKVDTSTGKLVSGTQYHKVNSFVSGSFGRVDMGKHATAFRSHGAGSTDVGNGVANNGYVNTRMQMDGWAQRNVVDGMTYSSPSFNGLSVAYSYNPKSDSKAKDTKAASSLGVKYMGNVSGMGVGFGFGMFTPEGEKKKANNAWGVKVSKGAFAGSFGMGTTKKDNTGGSKDTKQTRFGVAYSAGKIGVGFSMLNEKSGDTKNSKQTMYAKYTVASGLTAYVQNISDDDKASDDPKKSSTLLVGTTISF